MDFKTFLATSNRVCVLYGPTQMGKTEGTRNLVDQAFQDGFGLVVLSCDNKTDQMEQFRGRFEKHYHADKKILILTADCKTLKKKLEKGLKERKKIIIFCLDNSSQIEKISENLTLMRFLHQISIPRIIVAHDEGDVVTKDTNVSVVQTGQSESHKKWIQLFNLLNEMGNDYKRIFITATPENVVYKYPVSRIFKVPVSPHYTGYDRISYTPFESLEETQNVFAAEYRRIMASGNQEAVLYCTDRKIDEGQDRTFGAFVELMPDAVISTYNGKGIRVYITHPSFEKTAQKIAKEENLKMKMTIKGKHEWLIEDMPICDFYEVCRVLGKKMVVTIGFDLMSRGISFVSSKRVEKPLAATTMIYRPGNTMHAVGITQAIGRILGCARPDLGRRLYAPKSVIENYRKFMKNQEKYIKDMEYSEDTSLAMAKYIHDYKLSRSLDKVKLRLNPQYGNKRIAPAPQNPTPPMQETKKDEGKGRVKSAEPKSTKAKTIRPPKATGKHQSSF